MERKNGDGNSTDKARDASNSAETQSRARQLTRSNLSRQTFRPSIQWVLGHKLTLNKLKIYSCQKKTVKISTGF